MYQERFTLEETEGLLGTARRHGVNVMLKYHGFCCVYAGWDEMRSVFRMDPDQGSYRFCPEWNYHSQELPLGFTLKGGPNLRQQLADWETALRIEYFTDPSECDVFHHSANKWTGLERILWGQRQRCGYAPLGGLRHRHGQRLPGGQGSGGAGLPALLGGWYLPRPAGACGYINKESGGQPRLL